MNWLYLFRPGKTDVVSLFTLRPFFVDMITVNKAFIGETLV